MSHTTASKQKPFAIRRPQAHHYSDHSHPVQTASHRPDSKLRAHPFLTYPLPIRHTPLLPPSPHPSHPHPPLPPSAPNALSLSPPCLSLSLSSIRANSPTHSSASAFVILMPDVERTAVALLPSLAFVILAPAEERTAVVLLPSRRCLKRSKGRWNRIVLLLLRRRWAGVDRHFKAV